MKKNLIIGTLLICCTSIFASNRYDDNRIFNERKKGEGTQIILGIADVWASQALYEMQKSKVVTTEDKQYRKMIDQAEKELAAAKREMTPAEQDAKVLKYEKKISRLKENIEILRKEKPWGYKGQILEAQSEIGKLDERIEKTSTKAVISTEEKNAKVESAKEKVSIARKNLIDADIKESKYKYSKNVRRVALVGSSLFIVDVLGRIYVWNALNANPTFTPVGTAAWKTAVSVFK